MTARQLVRRQNGQLTRELVEQDQQNNLNKNFKLEDFDMIKTIGTGGTQLTLGGQDTSTYSLQDQIDGDPSASVADPGSRIRLFSIPDPNFLHPGSRIRIEKFKYFNLKKLVSKL
jgi:hypothetical protein